MPDSLLSTPLCGVIPPLLTPLLDTDTLDVEGLERLIEHVLAGGVHGLFLLGTTGEGPCLSYRLRRELVERSCRQTSFRTPILVGVTETVLSEMATFARHAADVGVHALVVAPPYYLPPNQEELLAWVDDLLFASPLPLYLYNMPGLCKVKFDVDTVRRLRDRERILGVKDSSGDMVGFHRLLEVARERPDWSVLMGPEELLGEAMLMGAHGGVSGGANLHPRLYVALAEAAARGDLAAVRRRQAEVLQLGRIYRVSRSGSPIIVGLKAALAAQGVCSDLPARPFARLSAEDQAEIRRLVQDLDLDLRAELETPMAKTEKMPGTVLTRT